MPPSLTKVLSPIDNNLQMNKKFSPKGTHQRKVDQMPSSRGKQNTNSLTSLEVSCLMMSCQGSLYYLILHIYFPYFLAYRYFSSIVVFCFLFFFSFRGRILGCMKEWAPMLFIFLYTFGGDFLSCLFYPILRCQLFFYLIFIIILWKHVCLLVKDREGLIWREVGEQLRGMGEVKQYMDMLYEKNAFS